MAFTAPAPLVPAPAGLRPSADAVPKETPSIGNTDAGMKKKDTSLELAVAAADLAADGKALDISILELREISSVADYFVLASGRSHIQVESICDRIVEGVR